MELIKLIHSYGDFTLNVDNIKFEKGKIIGLIGENGAGKTTLMNAISGNLTINGEIKINGIKENDILYIPSTLTAYPFLTVSEFLDLVIKYTDTEKTKDIILDLLELKGKEKSLITNLSQGMNKKISLTPIFIRKYNLLILDEPFNSIDIKYIFELKKYIKNLSKN